MEAREDEFIQRTHIAPLPQSLEELAELFKYVLTLPRVEEVKITTKEIYVRRWVRDGEEVIPPRDSYHNSVDPEFLISKIELDEVPFDTEAHPYMNLKTATDMLSSRGLSPICIVGPDGPWIEAYFGYPDNPPFTQLFGMRVIKSPAEIFKEKLVVVGGTGPYLTDAVAGVAIDIGESA